MIALAGTALVLGVLGLAFRIYMGREAEDRLAAGEAVSIAELRTPLPKASFLVCPPGSCSTVGAAKSPVFDLPWGRLREYWIEVITDEPRILSVATDADGRRFIYVQHSPILRFPDIITVELVSLGLNRSSIAIYSRSRYGVYDFGKNRKRVERWLVLLEKVARPASTHRGRADTGRSANPKGRAVG